MRYAEMQLPTHAGIAVVAANHEPYSGQIRTPVHYYGYYSNRCRGARQKAKQEDDIPLSIISNKPPVDARRKANWARLIQKVYEVDPLECPNCGATMRIIALIDDPGLCGFSLLRMAAPSNLAPDVLDRLASIIFDPRRTEIYRESLRKCSGESRTDRRYAQVQERYGGWDLRYLFWHSLMWC